MALSVKIACCVRARWRERKGAGQVDFGDLTERLPLQGGRKGVKGLSQFSPRMLCIP